MSASFTSRAPSSCDRSDVHVRLLRLFASSTYRPPVPPSVALEILQLSQRPEVSFEEVTAVLEHDPVLAAKVLSIAQSALHAPRSHLGSLKQAVVRLGLDTMRDLVLEAAMKLRVFRVPGYDTAMARLAWHSTAAAHLMRAVCRRTDIGLDYAFLCGLLHDVGIAACLLALSDDPRAEPAPLELLEGVLEEVHEDASGLLARLWGLPPELQRLMGSHHQLLAGGTPHPVNAALIVAEGLACELDAGLVPREGWESPARPLDAHPIELFGAACEALHLGETDLTQARAESEGIVEALVRCGQGLAPG